MKRKLLFTLLILSPCFSLAQNERGDHEISIGYGLAPSDQLFDGWHPGFILSPTMSEYQNLSSTGTFFFDYKYFLGKSITIGLYAGIEKESGNWFYDDMSGHSDDWETQPLGTFSRTAFTISPEISFDYVNKKNKRVYGSLGIGATFQKETDVFVPSYYGNGHYYNGALPASETAVANNKIHINGYYSPLGYSFILGGHIQGFLEFGIGYKGLLNFGLTYRFRKAEHQLK